MEENTSWTVSQALPWDLRGPEARWEFKSKSLTSWKACSVLFSMQSLRHQACSEPASWLTHHKQGMPVAGRKSLPATPCILVMSASGWGAREMEILWRLSTSTGLDKAGNGFSGLWQLNWNTWGGTQVLMVNLPSIYQAQIPDQWKCRPM